MSAGRPLFVSFWTEGTAYKEEAAALLQTCKQHKLDTDIRMVPNLGTWQRNTQFKAKFLRDILKASGRPIVWLDADSRVVQYPSLFFNLDADIAVHYRRGSQLLSGTIYLEPNQRTFTLLDDWVSLNGSNQNTWDQRNLQAAVEVNKSRGLRVISLPPEYCKIYDLMVRDGGRAVINQMQASRRLKNAVSNRQVSRFAVVKGPKHRPPEHGAASLETLQEVCRDKKVVLVGNSAALLKPEMRMGEFIDTFDVVVRFNRGINSPELWPHLGKKCDLWVFNASVAPMKHQVEALKHFYPKVSYAIWISPTHKIENYRKHVNFDLYSKAFQPTVQSYRDFCRGNGFHYEVPREMAAKSRDPRWRAANYPAPSAGVRTIDLFLSHIKTHTSLSTVGFDFFSSKTWYNPPGYTSPHSHGREQKYAEKMFDAGLLTIY